MSHRARRSGRNSGQPGSPASPTKDDDEDFLSEPDAPQDSAGTDDPDVFSPEESPKKRTKKRATKAKTASIPKKTPRRTHGAAEKPGTAIAENPVAQLAIHEPGLGQLRLVPSKDTRLVNRWLAARDKLKIVERVLPSKIEPILLTPLGSLPDMANRDFKYSVELVDVRVTWDPVAGEKTTPTAFLATPQQDQMAKYSKIIKTWRIHVWNDTLPATDQKHLRLFPEAEPMNSRLYFQWRKKANPGPPLTDAEKHITRGGPLDIHVCPTQAQAEQIAAEACRLMNKYPADIRVDDFPERVLFGTKGKDSEMRRIIELMSLLVLGEFNFQKIRYVFRHQERTMPGQYCLYPVPNKLDISKSQVNLMYRFTLPVFIPDADEDARPVLYVSDTSFTQVDLDALPDVPSWWGFQYQQPSNLKPATDPYHIPPATMTKFFNYLCWQTFGHVGTLDSLNAIVREIGKGVAYKHTNRRYGPYGGQNLFRCDSALVEVSTAVAASISGPIPVAKSALPKTAKALAMQSAYEVYKRTNDALKMIEELFVSLDELHLEKSILTRDTYCKCESEEQKKEEAHICMLCFTVVLCTTMARTDDNRLICIRHFEHGPPSPEIYLKSCIVSRARNCESKHKHLVPSERHEIIETLTREDWLDGVKFRDAYDGVRTQTFLMHPGRISLDAVFPLWKTGQSFYLHHAQNVCLTAEFLNRLKGTDLPVMLAAASYAIKRIAIGDFLPEIELAFDHFAKIRNMIPYRMSDRWLVAGKTPKHWWPHYEKLMRSGVYDGSEPIYKWHNRIATPSTPKWDKATIKRLNDICIEIENSPKYNPRKLTLPRGPQGSGGVPSAPWLWNPDHKFADHDWKLIETIFRERFRRMDNTCDWVNNHDNESAETLFLACVILWFELDGGKDEVLGLRMTVFSRHALSFSIGRATKVAPGSIMITGWSSPNPTSLSQYDHSRCTITMETWCMNRGKWQYPVTKRNIEIWKQMIRDVPSQSQFWDTFSPIHTSQFLDYPSTWKGLIQQVDADDEDALEEEAELEDDREVGDNDQSWDDSEFQHERGEAEGGNQTQAEVDNETKADADVASKRDRQVSYLLSFLDKIPEDERVRYAETVKDLASVSIPVQRIDLFERAIGKMIKDHGMDKSMYVDVVSHTTIDDWQTLQPDIATPFTEQEIVSFCVKLNEKDNFE